MLTNRYIIDVAAIGRLEILDLPASPFELRQPRMTTRDRVAIDLDAVSYTHLDVYKRQGGHDERQLL